MKRLTERNKNSLAMAACCGKSCEYNYVCEVGGFGECRGIDDIIDRLADIEDILGDDYDLDRLKVLVNQRMTMREEVAERFSITKDIPANTLREMVNSPYWMSPVCVGCPGKTEDGHRTEKCGYPDDMTLCEEKQKRLFELVDADREGRCVMIPNGGYTEKDGENALKSAMNTCFYHNNPVTRYIADAVAEKLAREEADLKGRFDD